MVRPRLGEILRQQNLITESQLTSALSYQKRWNKRLGESLVALNFLSDVNLARSLATVLQLPLIEITQIDPSKITRDILAKVSVNTARKHRIVPLAIKEVRLKKRLIIGTSDPTNWKGFDEIQFGGGLPVLPMITTDSEIDWFIRVYYLHDEVGAKAMGPMSVLEDGDTDPGQIEAISSIFFDENFTGITKLDKKK